MEVQGAALILTGSEIRKQYEAGRITIAPFRDDLVKVDSYNYRLGPKLKIYRGEDHEGHPVFEEIAIPDDGFVLPPLQMTLGHTAERIGSSHYAMSLIGRSSMGRLGLFLQVDADLGHTTSSHQWTLELVAVKPLRVYAGMVVGQVTFWVNDGEFEPYSGTYGRCDDPTEARVDMNGLVPQQQVAGV
jgi:dCTP deaminase